MINFTCVAPRAARSIVAMFAALMVAALMVVIVRPAAAQAAEDGEAQTAAESTKPAPQQVSAGGLDWYVDYYEAYRDAAADKRFLLINVTPATANATQQGAEQYIATSEKLQKQLTAVIRLRVPADATINVEGESRRLLSFPAFADLAGGPGFVLIDLCNENESYYGHTVSVLPYAGGKYYHWRPDYLSTILGVPAGTLTQRTMIWAVRIHPEAPQSTGGVFHPSLADGAMQQASYQASVGVQGHQNFGSRFQTLSAAAGGSVAEVCAESWPNENLIDSCIDCVDSWRHSSGHWQGVSRPHRAFGYDIRRGRNGIWYGTGIFAD